LVNQFVAGLLPEIKSGLVGMEGNFSQLLAKARFEEAKLHHLGSIQSTSLVNNHSVPGSSMSLVSPRNDTYLRPQRPSVQFRTGPRCYNCGSSFHFIKQCPYSTKQKYSEATGNRHDNANVMKESTAMKGNHVVSNIAPVDNAANNSNPDEVKCHSCCE